MFTAALFIIAKIWEQPKCPYTDEWIKKMCHSCTHTHTHTHTHTLEYYLATKKTEIMLFAAIWVGLEIAILSENQTERDKYHMIPLIHI